MNNWREVSFVKASIEYFYEELVVPCLFHGGWKLTSDVLLWFTYLCVETRGAEDGEEVFPFISMHLAELDQAFDALPDAWPWTRRTASDRCVR